MPPQLSAVSVTRRSVMRNGFMMAMLAGIGGPAAAVDANTFLDEEGFAYADFDRLPLTRLRRTDAAIDLGMLPDPPFAIGQPAILAWVERSAQAVATYYGRFPSRTARILVLAVPGDTVQGGTTWGYQGAAARIVLGKEATAQVLKQDWVMVHEMIHMALPDLPRRHHWLSEGIAVYVESIARVQAGDLRAEEIWGEFVRQMPRGLPRAGDHGLDGNLSHGRIYWGGALFCLLADVAIRKESNNRQGLQTALRAVNMQADHTVDWPIERIFNVADSSLGSSALIELYEAHRNRAVATDLAGLWRDLGVTADATGDARFDDRAPLAAIRRQITVAMTGVSTPNDGKTSIPPAPPP